MTPSELIAKLRAIFGHKPSAALPPVSASLRTQGEPVDVTDLLAWIQQQAYSGQIQIARSLLGTGYEVALCRPASISRIFVKSGTFIDVLEAVRKEVP